MNNARELGDGSLLFPKRGDPPDVIDGYIRSERDAYILLPILPSCQYRQLGSKSSTCNCDTIEQFPVCTRGYKITLSECNGCIATGRRDQRIG